MIHDNYAAGDKARSQQPDYFAPNSSGMVLVVVIILAAVAGILAAGLHFASSSRITQVRQEMRFDKAFFVAEAGIERAKANLRTNITSGVLFGGFTGYGEGRFYANIRNSSSGTNHFIIRSTGIVETATRVIEVEVEMTPFVPGQADGALGIYGTNTDLVVKGSGAIDGNDWNVPTAIGGNDATTNSNPSAPGVFYTSLSTDIDPQKADSITGNPPTTNGVGVYNETDWTLFVNRIMPATCYADGDPLGTRAAPIITLLPGGTTMFNGNRVGAGILIVPGDATLKINGTFDYEGLIVLVGDGIIDVGDELSATGTAKIFGSIICIGAELDINIQGTFDLNYSTQALANLARLQVPAQLDMISWKEIKASSAAW